MSKREQKLGFKKDRYINCALYYTMIYCIIGKIHVRGNYA